MACNGSGRTSHNQAVTSYTKMLLSNNKEDAPTLVIDENVQLQDDQKAKMLPYEDRIRM